MVSGASNGSNHPAGYSRVRVISGIETGPSSVLEDELIPGGTKLLEKLQGKVSVEESVISAVLTNIMTLGETRNIDPFKNIFYIFFFIAFFLT